MRRTITLILALVLVFALAVPAMAHPVTPPGLDGDEVAFAGNGSGAHTKGLACAEDRSPAIGFLPIECTLGFGGD